LSLPKVDGVVQSSPIGLFDEIDAALSDGSHLHTASYALYVGLDRVPKHLQRHDLGLLESEFGWVDIPHCAYCETRTINSELYTAEGPRPHPLTGPTTQEVECDRLAFSSGPPRDEEFDVVASSFYARISAKILDDGVQTGLDFKAIIGWRQPVGAGEA
jgi:hypothetical protein